MAISTLNSTSTDSTAVSTLKGMTTNPDNSGQTMNSGSTTALSINNMLNLRQKWRRPGRTLLLSFTESHATQRQPQTTASLVDNFDSAGALLSRTVIDESIRQSSVTDGLGASAAYTEPLKPGHLLDWSYRVDRSVSRSDRSGYDYDSAKGVFDLPDSAGSNHFTTTNTIQRLGMGYDVTEGKYQYQLGLGLQFSELDNRNRTLDSTLRLRQTNWYPRANLIYTAGQGRSFNIQYNANTTSPTLDQLQPVTDPTNPFLIKLGNPRLEQQLTHNVGLAYNAFDTRSFRNWQLALDGSYSEHAIVPATTVLAGGIQQQQYVNADGVWTLSGNMSFGFPLGDQKKGNASVAVNGRYGRGVSIVNGLQQIEGTPGGGLTGKLNLHPGASLFAEASGVIIYTENRYSANPAQNTAAWSQHYTVELTYLLPAAVTLSTYYSLALTSGTLPAPAVSVWNASIAKDLGRRRRWQARLSGLGLLNNTKNVSQTMNAGTLSTVQTNIPGRVVLATLVWRVSKFQKR